LPSLTRSGSNGRSAVADADLQAAIDRGITVAEVTYSNSISVSEHVVVMIVGLVRNYIPSYQWVVKGGWHIAEYVTRSYDVEGMHAGTVAAGRIGLAVLRRPKPFGMHLYPRQRAHSPLRARQDHDHGRLDDDARPCDDELGLLTMLTSPTLWGLCSYFLPAMA
jgi:formate dehydrogenase